MPRQKTLKRKFYRVKQGGFYRGKWIEAHFDTVDELLVLVKKGIAFGPYETPPGYNWGEGEYEVFPDGTFKCTGSNWDTSG